MGNLVDLLGKTFGQWTVIGTSRRRTSHGHVYWFCRCSCGTEKDVRGATLREGTSKRCPQCAHDLNLQAILEGRKPLPMTAAVTLGYSYEPRFNGRYFAVLRHTLWRGREGTRFVVGYDNEQDARDLVHALSTRKLKEGPRPE